MTKLPETVLLSTQDTDLGLLPGAAARQQAETYADLNQVSVQLRDPVTDRLLLTVAPDQEQRR